MYFQFCDLLYSAVSNSGCIALSVTVTDDESEGLERKSPSPNQSTIPTFA
jgi:hypothetical protein